MLLDPLIAFGLTMLLWAAGIAYVLRQAAREERRRMHKGAQLPARS